MASKVVAPGWKQALRRWAYYKSYFPELGLMRDDILYEDEHVKKAIARLPKRVYDDRIFRLTRALDLSNKKITLPKEEWTKFEDDVRYLQPYLDEVKKEENEKAEWMKQ